MSIVLDVSAARLFFKEKKSIHLMEDDLNIRSIVYIGLNVVMLFSCVSRTMSLDEKIASLEPLAAEIDTMFNVSARKYVDVYFQLSDAYTEKHEYQKAYTAVLKGLQLDSANQIYQYAAAYLEVENKKYTEAYQRLQYILHTGNDPRIIRKCNELLKTIDTVPMEKTIVKPMYEKSILVLVFPDVWELAADAIVERIRQDYKLSVIREVLPETETTVHIRDSRDAYIQEYIEKISQKEGEESLTPFLYSIGLTKADLKTKENRVFFMMQVFKQLNYTEADWKAFNTELGIQYDASMLITQVKQYAATRYNDSNILGVLAITSKDIYSGSDDNNFLFGLYERKTAVMSLKRFMNISDGNAAMINRTVMQALSSVGHIVGIPRCSILTCARAYAHSLEEQDKKSVHLCFECINNINKCYDALEHGKEQ